LKKIVIIVILSFFVLSLNSLVLAINEELLTVTPLGVSINESSIAIICENNDKIFYVSGYRYAGGRPINAKAEALIRAKIADKKDKTIKITGYFLSDKEFELKTLEAYEIKVQY